MLNYDMPLYRPPSEGPNLIIQATIGCSYNQCTFCSMYHSKSYSARPLDVVLAEIEQVAQQYPETRRVFLADGDAMVLPTDDLLQILQQLKQHFPRLSRVSSYALPANLRRKSVEELLLLKENGLTLLYYGLESGSKTVLKKIRKGAVPDGIVEGLKKAQEAGMKISATVILGLGGQKYWQEHIDETANLINRLELNYLSTLQLGLDPAIEKRFYEAFGDDFEWQDDYGMLQEQARLIAAVNPNKTVIFRSNHASNSLPMKGNLPTDRERLLAELMQVENGEITLIPKYLRGY